MDWKILVAIVVILLGFGVFKMCSDEDAPNWDKQRTEQLEMSRSAADQAELKKAREKRDAAIEEAREARGEQPEERVVHLESEEFVADLTTRGGSLRSFKLTNPQFVEYPRDWISGVRDEETKQLVPVDMVSTNPDYEINNPLRFEIYQGLDGLLPDADYRIIDQDKDKVVFRYEQPGLPVVILKKFEVDRKAGPYQMWVTVQVTNKGTEKVSFLPGIAQTGYQHGTEVGGGLFSKQPNLLQGLCRHEDELYREPWNSGDAGVPYTGLNVVFAGVETNYFLSAMVPDDDLPTSCRVQSEVARVNPRDPDSDPVYGVIRSQLRWGEVTLEPGQSQIFKVKNFMGPKQYSLLQSIGHDLEKAVNFGWLAVISRVLLWILFQFQKLVVNWGVAIILLTVTVKLALLPIAHKAFKSTDRMKELKPEVDKLNEKYKDDPQEKQKQVMALYKKHKVNPLGGCLPMLLQMPIWFALFRTLRASPELYRAEFVGWIHDLSSSDPYYILPVLMGIAMFAQQWFTPMTGDNAQAKMMKYFMPIMFGGMMLFYPAGLTLYIFVNVLLSIAHQMVIQRLRARKTAKK